MNAAPLPLRQYRVLAYLDETGPATTWGVAKALRMDRDSVQNALVLLADKRLVVANPRSTPAVYMATEDGRECLAAGDGA